MKEVSEFAEKIDSALSTGRKISFSFNQRHAIMKTVEIMGIQSYKIVFQEENSFAIYFMASESDFERFYLIFENAVTIHD